MTCRVHVDGVTPDVIVSVTPSEKLAGTRREERKAGSLAVCHAVEAYIVSQNALAHTVANMANNDCRLVSGTPIAKPKRERREYQRNLMRARWAKDRANAAPDVRRTERQDRAL